MPPNPTPSENFLDEIVQLKRRIAELERRTLRNVVIPEGGVRIKNDGVLIVETDGGFNMFYLGPLVSGGVPLRGILLRRENGQQMFANGVSGGDPDKVFFAWKDNAENILFSDDANAGVGISRPWLSMPSVPVINSAIPVTTSGTFVSIYSTGYILKCQSNVEVQALLYSTGGATGEARFTINGIQVGSTVTINNGDFAWTSPASLSSAPAAYGTYIRVELQVRRTNASGSVGGVLIASQRQS
jgi:hypothetical protein